MASTYMTIFRTRLFKGVAAVVMVVAFGIWFVTKEQSIRNEAWKGVVVEEWEKKPLLSWGISNRTKHRRRTHYYWRVKRDDGETVEVKVPHTLYNQGGPGSKIEKIYKERYPRVAQ